MAALDYMPTFPTESSCAHRGVHRWLLAQGRTVPEVSAVLAFAPRWVTKLAARYNALGPEALGDGRRHNGKAASLLSQELLAALAERVKAPPEDGGLWSGPKAAAWIAARLGLA